MLKKYGLWIALALAAYMFKDKWMPLLKGGENKEGGEKKAADVDTNDYA
jgi:hypothetical protein